MTEREELAKRFYGLPITDGERLLVAREVMRFAADELKKIYEGSLTPRALENAIKARIAALSPPKCEHPADQLEPRLYADGIGVFKCKACGATAPAVPGEWRKA